LSDLSLTNWQFASAWLLLLLLLHQLLLPLRRYAMAKWIRARPYVTVEEVAARIQQYQAAQQGQQDTQPQQLAALGQLLAVAVAR
jgi:hypothetical protein